VNRAETEANGLVSSDLQNLAHFRQLLLDHLENILFVPLGQHGVQEGLRGNIFLVEQRPLCHHFGFVVDPNTLLDLTGGSTKVRKLLIDSRFAK